MSETSSDAIVINKSTLLGFGIALVLVINMGLVAYIIFGNKQPVNPNNPVAPVTPVQKTLRDLVDPESATKLATLYHDLATTLKFDGPRQDRPNEGKNILTVYDFKQTHDVGTRKFQATHQITGLSSLARPIKEKLDIGLGNLDDDVALDDPRLNVREKLIAITLDIAQELDPEIAKYPVGTYK